MKKSKGITLIALVITIIVLLILAGVSLRLIAGDEGILGRAEKAVKKNETMSVKEEIDLAIAEKTIEFYELEKHSEGFDTAKEYVKSELKNGIKTSNGNVKLEEEKITYTSDDGKLKATGIFDESTGTVKNMKISNGSTDAPNDPELSKFKGNIQFTEEKRRLTVSATQVEEGIEKIEILNPKGTLIGEQEFEGNENEGKIENCIANRAGMYKVIVTDMQGNKGEKTITVEKIEISNKTELENFRDMVNSGITFEGDTVYLMANIDLGGSEENRNWEGIGRDRKSVV